MAEGDCYELVSSLYSPGTTACWYLTMLSCLVSWTIHPKSRTSGYVNDDFIALLTFPAVAAGHLNAQISAYPGCKHESINMDDMEMFKLSAAIEAPLNIIEKFMATAMILFLVALAFKCMKRIVFLALGAMFCFSAEIYFSCPA